MSLARNEKILKLINLIIENKAIIIGLLPHLYFIKNKISENSILFISFLIISFLMFYVSKLIKEKNSLNKENTLLRDDLNKYSLFSDDFEVELSDGIVVKSGVEIQLKNTVNKKLIAKSFCEKENVIKHINDKNVEDTTHISALKGYKYQQTIFFG